MYIKEIRLKENKTQKEIAMNSEITESFYCLIEKGARRPSPHTAKAIAKALNFEKYQLDWTLFFEH